MTLLKNLWLFFQNQFLGMRWLNLLIGEGLAALGLVVLPARKRKAKGDFTAKLEDLRTRLVSNLEQQFEREMRRSTQRIEDTVAPFDRFVRSERDRLTSRQQVLQGLSATISDLTRQLS